MIRLLLNGYEVEFTTEPDILFNYKVEDTDNPTAVRNNFSKTITIPSTKRNNNIFGSIYRTDRTQEYATDNMSGIYFDPSKRVPFILCDESNIIESGYFKLDKIDGHIDGFDYTITLYGGLGDFIYTLMYNEDGEKIKLSDLKWNTFFNGEYHTPIDGDEFGLVVDNQEVTRGFLYLPKGDISDWTTAKKAEEGLDIFDWITFMPSYNGYYEDFDNDKAIIYVDTHNGNDVFSDAKYTSVVKDGETFKLYEEERYRIGTKEYIRGFAKAELGKELTEWEIRDLRAYKQRPALRLRRLIEACCDKENNGGYDVDLDKDFFNDNNPYWNETYIALPLLDSLIQKSEKEEVTSNLIVNGPAVHYVTTNNNDTFQSNYVKYALPGSENTGFVVEGNNWVLDYPYTSEYNVHYTFELTCQGFRNLYFGVKPFIGKAHTSSIAVQLVAYNAYNDNVIGYSSIYNFTDSQYPLEMDAWKNSSDKGRFYGETIENIGGYFERGVFKDVNSQKNSTFELTIENVPIFDKVYFRLLMCKGYDRDSLSGATLQYQNVWDIIEENAIYIDAAPTNKAYAILTYTDNDSINKVTLSKEKLFTMDNSPADYLLSFCKLFGLKLSCDSVKKEVKIEARNNFFTDEIEDIEKWIDRGGDIEIKPLTFDYKWMNMALQTDETKYSQLYKKDYDVIYGCKRINTNYNFNSEENDVFDGNVFHNGVTVLDRSEAYFNFMDENEHYLPTLNTNYYEYKLFNGSGEDMKDEGFYVYPYQNTFRTPETSYGRELGTDSFPKICYFNDDYGVADFGDCLVLRNGLKSIFDGDGRPVWYSVSDDIPEMYAMNGSPCYMYAYPETYLDNLNWTYSLPVFTKYKTDTIKMYDYGDEYQTENANITHSLDFGSPREMYNKWANNDDANIYAQYWKKFIEDQCSINTRIVTCRVHWPHRINADSLRKMYYFDNAYWVLNEVEDYSIGTDGTTKCTFIKVQNIDNYTKGQKI